MWSLQLSRITGQHLEGMSRNYFSIFEATIKLLASFSNSSHIFLYFHPFSFETSSFHAHKWSVSFQPLSILLSSWFLQRFLRKWEKFLLLFSIFQMWSSEVYKINGIFSQKSHFQLQSTSNSPNDTFVQLARLSFRLQSSLTIAKIFRTLWLVGCYFVFSPIRPMVTNNFRSFRVKELSEPVEKPQEKTI